jgi:hypothetical protein
MAKTVKIAKNPEHDSTLPKTELKLGKETFYLCFTFAALSLAETQLRRQGVECNLLKALDVRDLDATKLSTLLYAGLITHKPEITYEEVLKLITFKNMFSIPDRITTAYAAALADSADDDAKDGKADPTQPE